MHDLLYLAGWNQLIALLMGLAVWLACRTPALRRRPAVCHGLWLLVLLKLVTPPLVSLPVLPAMNSTVASTSSAWPDRIRPAAPLCDCCPSNSVVAETPGSKTCRVVVFGAAASAADPKPKTAPAQLNSRAIWLALLGISLLVTCALWVVAAHRFERVRRLMRGATVEPDRVTPLMQEVTRRFNSRAALKLRIVDAPITPMLWAVPGNPAVILPRQLVNSLSDEGLRSILAHELAHFVRHDHWTNWFAFLATTLFWWNPIVWFARRELLAAAEACCDALVLERLHGSRRSYAETLLTVIDSLAPATPPRSAFGMTFGESRSLRRRFEILADADASSRMTWRGWALLSVGFVALLLAPARGERTPKPPSAAVQQHEISETQLPTDDRQGVALTAMCCPS